MHEPGSRETAVVAAGEVASSVEGGATNSATGDSVTFDADLPHHFENHGDRAGARSSRSSPPGSGGLMAQDAARQDLGPPRGRTTGLIYIDLHLVHEVTSPQAFESLRLAGRAVRRPDRTLATADHNVPTTAPAARLVADPLSRKQVGALKTNCAEFGIPIHSIGSDRQGIVHVIGPELGVTQPGMTIVCGDSHTSTHRAFGALAFGIGT